MAKKDFNVARDVIVAKMLEQMENGEIPWEKPWFGMGYCYNYKNGRPYNFINELMLGEPGAYITGKQLKALGGSMKEGEEWKDHCRRAVGVFSSVSTDKDGNPIIDKDGKPKTHRSLKYYYVVNTKYTTLPEKKRKTHLPPKKSRTADKVIKAYLDRSGVTMQNRQGDRAFYVPMTDSVTLPEMAQFKEQAEYYSTAFHELGHSTGHPSRLNRFKAGDKFGSEPYAREELVAEFTAAILNNYCDLGTEHSERNSAAYLQNWAKAIKDDPQMFVYAAYKADAAASLILGREEKKNVVEPSAA